MITHNSDLNILSLLKNLESIERMRNITIDLLEDSKKNIKSSNLFSKIFKKSSLTDWAENIKKCEQDICEYNDQISNIKKLIGELQYTSNEIKNVQRFLISEEKSHFAYILEQDNPWVNLLNKSEREDLDIEIAAGKKGTYETLISLTNYINSFKTNNEQLDFIHGFNPDYKTQVEETHAYKIGNLFYTAKTELGIDLQTTLKEYAPKYRHNLEFVSLVSDLHYENNLRNMAIIDLNEPLGAGCSPEDLKCFYDEIVANRLQDNERWEEQIKSSDHKISLIKEKINTFGFHGKIDYLGQDKNNKTIVGETIYYDNYKDYKKEIDESNDCGRPIAFEEIDKESIKNIPREDSKNSEPETIINSNSKYTVLQKAGANRLLRRMSDGEVVIAKGWDGESWLSGGYYGSNGLASAINDWKNTYSHPGSHGYNVKPITHINTQFKASHR